MKIPFNPRNRNTQILVAALLLLLLSALFTQCARADEKAYMQFGVGSAVVRGATPGISLQAVFPDVIKDTDVEIGTTMLGESTFRDQLQRNNFAFHAGIVDGFGPVEVGLGAAYLQNTDEYNGSHLNFQLLLGYKFKKFPATLRLQHFSNAGTKMPNRGRDMLLFYYRF